MARVLIADDDARFRGLARRAMVAGGHTVVGEAATAVAALALAVSESPDIALVDVHLGTDSGWTLASTLSTLGIRRVIVTSNDPDALHGAPAELLKQVAFTPKPALAALAL
jgi:DNA-binding NarL/FixJ family response regulator